MPAHKYEAGPDAPTSEIKWHICTACDGQGEVQSGVCKECKGEKGWMVLEKGYMGDDEYEKAREKFLIKID